MRTARGAVCGALAIAALQADQSGHEIHVRAGIESWVPRCAPAVSDDGNVIAFMSAAALVETDRNTQLDVYVFDRRTQQVELLSKTAAGSAGIDDSYCPSLSGNGRLVAFLSDASDLVPGDTVNTPDIFLVDRQAGLRTRLTAPFDGPDMWYFNPIISGDGSHVVFEAAQLSDQPLRHVVYRLRVGDTRVESLGYGGEPTVSADGTIVAFSTAGQTRRILVHDGTGVQAVAAADGGVPDHNSYAPRLSGDGRWLAFVSRAGNLLARAERRDRSQVYLQRVDGSDRTLVSATRDGTGGNGPSGSPSIDHTGAHVTFDSRASDLGCAGRRGCEPDVNLVQDVFVWERATRTVQQISGAGPEPWMDPSELPAISGDGRVVAFLSRHPMHDDDDRVTFDVFVRGGP